MRQNYPVTTVEYSLIDGKHLVSKTDLRGRIIYANPYFIEASGYSEAELIGASHNVVRHPDMPAEAFQDLWATLHAGLPWTGLLKNRRKNGDYYWAEANVTPMVEKGKVIGYLSVRSKAVRAQVQSAERAYQHIRGGNTGVTIRQGQLMRSGLSGIAARLLGSSLRWRVGGALAAIALLFAAIGVAGLTLVDGTLGRWFGAAGALGVCAIAALEFAVRHSVGIPMQEAIATARAIAGGDLSCKIHTRRRDDVGQLLRAMQQMSVNLTAMIGDVRTSVDSMTAATGDIASGNSDLSARTEAQAANLEETAASLAQLALAVRQNADHTQHASQLVAGAVEVAGRGGEAVSRVGATMAAITQAGKRIEDITGLIDGIAFQTNLLALNAAVEAAKAGERGRGFAVVAGEVRSLAQRSAGAARDIKRLIDATVLRLTEGDRLVGDASDTMAGIVTSVRRVDGIVAEMAEAGREQSSNIEQINRAVVELDRNTQQNAALVEQAAVAAESLHEQAGRLRATVGMFTLAMPGHQQQSGAALGRRIAHLNEAARAAGTQ